MILRRLPRIPRDDSRTLSTGLLVLLLLAAVPATATTARIAALGGRADFFTDDTEARRWCASLTDYPGLVIIEAGHFDLSGGYHDQWGSLVSGPGIGIHAALDQSGRWGTAGFFLHARGQDADPGTLHHDDPTGNVGVVYARRFGAAAAAIRYDRADETTPLVGADGIQSGVFETTVSSLGGGLRMDLGQRVMLDLGGELRGTTQNPHGPADGKLNSWRSFGLRGRAFIQLRPGLAVVPMAGYIHEKLPLMLNRDGVPATVDLDRELVHLGLGLNLFPDPDNMLVCSGEWLHAYDNARSTLPAASPGGELIDQAVVFRLAFETRLNPWLIARAAAGLETVTRDSPAGNQNTDHVPLSLGLSLHAARLTLDLAVSDRLPRTLTRLAVVANGDEDEDSTWLTVNFRFGFGP